MEDALECEHWRCPDPRGKLPFSIWEEAIMGDVENVGKTIWNTRFGSWVNRGPLFSVLYPKRKDDSPTPPLRHALRAKIFKAIPKHEPAVLRWMFDKFSDPKWKKNRWWYAPYAFNEQGDPFTAFSYLAEEFDPEMNKLELKNYMASKRADTYQALPVNKSCVPIVGVQKKGALSRIKHSKPMTSGDGERSCSSMYEVKEDFNMSEAESTIESTTPTVCTVDLEERTKGKGRANSPSLGDNEAALPSKKRSRGHSHPRSKSESSKHTSATYRTCSPEVEDMYSTDNNHLEVQPSKRQLQTTLETTVISGNDELEREREWWISLAVSVMGEGKLLSARDDPRDVNSGRSHEEFSELIIHHVQVLSTLSGNTFTLCHAAALPAYPSSHATRKRIQWWQKVADTVVKGGVTLRVRGEESDVERGQHICHFASEIHKYAQFLGLDRHSKIPRSASPGNNVKGRQPATYASSARAQQSLSTKLSRRPNLSGHDQKSPLGKAGPSSSLIKQKILRDPQRQTNLVESIESHSDNASTSTRFRLESARPAKRKAWSEQQEEDQRQYMRRLELQNPTRQSQKSR